jgi:cytochrome P450
MTIGALLCRPADRPRCVRSTAQPEEDAVTTSQLSARFDEAGFYLGDPHAVYATLRRDDPVHWYADGPFWVITKYQDIRFISMHPELFSSAKIAILGDIIKARAGQPGPPRDTVLFMDPPEHLEHRKVLNHQLTPSKVNALDADVRQVVAEVCAALPEGEFDAIELLAEPIPVFVFSRLLGVPRDDWQRVVHWSTVITNSGGGMESEATMAAVYAELIPYLEALIDERRRAPRDDFLTVLSQGAVNGAPLTPIQVVWWAVTLLAAGSETTQSLIAGILWAMTQHPHQAARLLAQPALAAAAVEETLRWWTPVNSMARQATTDVELRGKTVRAGDNVLLMYGSANRDEEVWGDDADDWDMLRPSAQGHLAFGFAEHFCMGAHLARREVRLLVEELARRADGIELAGPPIRRTSTLMTTFDRLPVRLVG